MILLLLLYYTPFFSILLFLFPTFLYILCFYRIFMFYLFFLFWLYIHLLIHLFACTFIFLFALSLQYNLYVVPLPIVLNKEIAQSVMTWLQSEDEKTISPLQFKVINVTDRKASRKSPPPFITSTLQQECSRRLNMNPSRCMSIAQELYEEGSLRLPTYIPYLAIPT